jgi:glycogenin
MKAYITLLSTMSYLPGVIVLNESLKQVKSSYLLWVGISENIPVSVDDELKQHGMHVVRLPASIEIPDAFKSGHWGNTFDKLHLFGLTNFTKMVYLDSDMIVMTNIDELFEKPHMSAVAAGRLMHPEWKRLNSGLMVIEPQDQLPEKIAGALPQALQETALIGTGALGDQDLINAFYSDWPDTKALHLDDGYNIFYSHLDSYIENHGYSLPVINNTGSKSIRVVHFIGPNKPWMKWAGIKHFYNTLRRRKATKWERKVFVKYLLCFRKLQF